jgi:hypothetical protein
VAAVLAVAAAARQLLANAAGRALDGGGLTLNSFRVLIRQLKLLRGRAARASPRLPRNCAEVLIPGGRIVDLSNSFQLVRIAHKFHPGMLQTSARDPATGDQNGPKNRRSGLPGT